MVLYAGHRVIQQYHECSFTPEGYLCDVSYPLYLVGISLILGAVILFIPEFYPIEKEKIKI
jgi:hypothetical protein